MDDMSDELLKRTELNETLAGIRRGLAQADRGEGQLASDFFRELAERFAELGKSEE